MRQYFVKQDGNRWNVICRLHGKEIVVEVKKTQALALAVASKLRNHYKGGN